MENKTGLDWNNLKYFLAVARGGGLSGAATMLATSASTVSRHIDDMEATLGTRLFLRQSRGYLLTDAGTELLERVEEVERAVLALERQGTGQGVEGTGQGVEGTVKMATYESLAHYLLLPQLHELHARHPQLVLELVISRNQADLSRREADLALLISDPRRRDYAPDYVAHRIGTFRFELYASRAALRKAGKWQDLPHVTWDTAWIKLPMAEWLATLFPKRAPIFRANTMQAHYLAAVHHLGAAMLPSFIGDKDRRLRKIDTGTLDTTQELWLMYHRDLKASARVRAVSEFVRTVWDAAAR